MTRALFALMLAVAVVTCSTPPSSGPDTTTLVFPELKGASRPVSGDPAAQRFFDQGLMLAYGFNHDEAQRSFRESIRRDPACAMAWWGVAYALSPNINRPLTDPDESRRGREAADRALALATRVSPADRSLIEAMAERFPSEPVSDRAEFDRRYAASLREAWRRFPEDPDIGALFADAMLNLSPWNQWTKDGRPQPGTAELVLALERVLQIAPQHPLGLHLYIHAVEASPTPERALPAAEKLRGAFPGAGHLLHMPAHVYVRLGQWGKAVDVNEQAVEADREYLRRAGPQGIYEAYKAHNHHFIIYASMFLGSRAKALEEARDMVAEISPEAMKNLPELMDCYLPQALHVMIRFGMWREILEEPTFEGPFPIAQATRLYARGVALANLDRIDEAEATHAQFRSAAEAMPESARVVGTPARAVFVVAQHMLEGEILFRKGQHEAAFQALRRGVAAEDDLPYDEPKGWMQPVRHALGALLLQQGQVNEAEAAYREDLRQHPGNGWALHGLSECLLRKNEREEAERTKELLARAWSRADVSLVGSCYCRRR